MVSKQHLFGALLIAILAVVAIHAINFPGSVPHFKQEAGGLPLLDTHPLFEGGAIHERVIAYGDRGRAAYRARLFTVDVLLPLCVTAFLFAFMLTAIEKMQLRGALKVAFLSGSFIYLLFDLLENAFLFDILSDYPLRHAAVEAALPYLTTVKRIGAGFGLFAPPILFAIAALKKRGTASSNQAESSTH